MELERLASIFEACKVLPLRPTDLLVFRANVKLGLDQMAALHNMIEEATGHARILILDGGADLAVIRPEEEPEPPPATRPDVLPNGQVRRGSAPGAIA